MKLPEKLANDLRRRILAQDLDPQRGLGTESQLLETYDISRPTLREAIRILESENLISVTRGARSVKVIQPDLHMPAKYFSLLLRSREVKLHDLYSARLIVEPSAVRLLTETAWDSAPSELNALIDREEAEIGDLAAFAKLTVEFHEKLTELSGNLTIHTLIGSLRHIFEAHALTLAKSTQTDPSYYRLGLRAHRKLTELISHCRPREAELFWARHLSAVASSYYLSQGENDVFIDVLD